MKNIEFYLRKIEYHYIVLALLVIIVNITLSTRYFISDADLTGDQRLYYSYANAITQEIGKIEEGSHDIGALMAPGYSFLLAGIFYIFGDNVANAFYVNIALHILTAMLLFYLMAQISNTFIAWGFSIWLLFYYQIWRMNYLVMMEITTIFFIAFSFYFLFKYIKNQKINYLIIFSILAGILIFVNNRFIFHFAVILVTIPVYAYFKQYYEYRDAIILGMLIFLVLLPWHIRQYVHYDELVIFAPARTGQISSLIERDSDVEDNNSVQIMGPTEIMPYEDYLNSFAAGGGMTESRMGRIREAFTKEKYEQMVKDYERKYNKGYWRIISRLTGFWEIWQFDFSFNWGGDTRIRPPARLEANVVNILILTPMFLFFVIGVFYAFYKKAIFVQILSLFILSHWILHAYVHYIPRYRITVLPLIFLVAWYGIYQLSQIDAIWNIKQKIYSYIN